MSQLNAIIVRILLDGQNYPEWAFLVETILWGPGLLFHLTDDSSTHKADGTNAKETRD